MLKDRETKIAARDKRRVRGDLIVTMLGLHKNLRRSKKLTKSSARLIEIGPSIRIKKDRQRVKDAPSETMHVGRKIEHQIRTRPINSRPSSPRVIRADLGISRVKALRR